MAVTRRSLWDVLGIENTSDPVAIRRAYARRLKVTNPEDDPEGFKELREAYEVALLHAHHARWAEAQGETGPEESVTDPVADATEHEPETYGPDSREDEQKPPVRRITAEEIARGVMDVQTGAVPSLTGSPLGVHERAASADTPSELDRLANSHREACGALARLVETPGAERRAIEAALDDLLKSPAMDSIDLHHRTEYWLASLILNGDDRGAALIDPAIRYFGWDSPRLGVTHQAGYAVLVRREELANLQQYARPGSPHARAFRSLRCKPRGLDLVLTRITPNLPDRVDHLLRKIRREKPVLERYLDAEAVAWWDHHLSATRVGPLTFWCAAVLAFVLNGFVPHGALAEFLPEALQLPVFLLLWAISFVGLGAGLVGLVLLRLYGLSWPRAWWRRRWAGRAPVWVRLGWAPAAL
ncbi:MAG TPA: hypothetical protein VEB59_09555, partial [Gemmatimonadales bacterium]|nr:hypothetical protein [Gemmatimonadales bacterium]